MQSKTLKLDASIYPLAAVERAVKAFSGIGSIRMNTRGGTHHILIRPVHGIDAEVAAWELGNYALAEAMAEYRRDDGSLR